jgi:hypothetical protein
MAWTTGDGEAEEHLAEEEAEPVDAIGRKPVSV